MQRDDRLATHEKKPYVIKTLESAMQTDTLSINMQ